MPVCVLQACIIALICEHFKAFGVNSPDKRRPGWGNSVPGAKKRPGFLRSASVCAYFSASAFALRLRGFALPYILVYS